MFLDGYFLCDGTSYLWLLFWQPDSICSCIVPVKSIECVSSNKLCTSKAKLKKFPVSHQKFLKK